MTVLRVAIAMSALVIAACSPAQNGADLPASPLALNDWAYGDVSMQALLEGTLAIRDGVKTLLTIQAGAFQLSARSLALVLP